jgi:hypothetical protein
LYPEPGSNLKKCEPISNLKRDQIKKALHF